MWLRWLASRYRMCGTAVARVSVCCANCWSDTTFNNCIVILPLMFRHVNFWVLRVENLLLRKRVIHKYESVDVAGIARRMVVSPSVLIFLVLHEGGMIGLAATMPRQSRLREYVSFSHQQRHSLRNHNMRRRSRADQDEMPSHRSFSLPTKMTGTRCI